MSRRLACDIDLCAADAFARSLAIAEEMDAPAIVLDLDRVSFMDSGRPARAAPVLDRGAQP